MSFFFEGNGYFDGSIVVSSSIGNSIIKNGNILQSSIDMLSVLGQYQNITNVKDPINLQDAATKKYVDDLEVSLTVVTLQGTDYTQISSKVKGSFVVTVSNLILNGPSAIFHITKNEAVNNAHIVRTVASPGVSSAYIYLDIKWGPTESIMLRKTGNAFDGAYKVKIS